MLPADKIAEEVIKSNGSRKALVDIISDGNFDEDEFDLLVEANEIILSRSVTEKQKYSDLTLSLIKSRKMWSEQELKLVDLLALANMVGGDTEYYRCRVRELLICLPEKDVLITVEESQDPFVISEQKIRPMIISTIKAQFKGISSKRILDKM